LEKKKRSLNEEKIWREKMGGRQLKIRLKRCKKGGKKEIREKGSQKISTKKKKKIT